MIRKASRVQTHHEKTAALEVSTSCSLEALCSGKSGVSALEESDDSSDSSTLKIFQTLKYFKLS